MRKLIVLAILLVSTICGYSQNVDNFEVGPYEVDYRGEGDFIFRVREGVTNDYIYELFGLQKDTIVIGSATEPVNNGMQVNVSLSVPRQSWHGRTSVWGIAGSWKQQVGKITYVNAGLSAALSFGIYNYRFNNSCSYNLEQDVLELGVPISIEFAKIDRKKATVFASIGFSTTFFKTLKVEVNEEVSVDEFPWNTEKKSGILLAPRVEVGSYVPVGNCMIRMGWVLEYKTNCSRGAGEAAFDIYSERIGCAFFGANLGLLF